MAAASATLPARIARSGCRSIRCSSRPSWRRALEDPELVIVQALIGAAAPALAFALAAQLFDRRVGLLTAFLVAVDPYAVVHDAAFQETVVLNVLVLLAVLLLSRAAASRSAKLAVGAGVVLSLAVLTTARIAPLAGLAVLWMAFGDGLRNTGRYRLAIVVATPIVLLVGLWIGRNATVVGAPVLTTETGQSLWFAHNRSTMTIYPSRSIDEVREVEWPQLDPATRDHIEAAAGDPVDRIAPTQRLPGHMFENILCARLSMR